MENAVTKSVRRSFQVLGRSLDHVTKLRGISKTLLVRLSENARTIEQFLVGYGKCFHDLPELAQRLIIDIQEDLANQRALAENLTQVEQQWADRARTVSSSAPTGSVTVLTLKKARAEPQP